MFPELTRDEVFRIETRRTWLRWPAVADAADLAAALSSSTIDGVRASVTLGGALGLINQWRTENEVGQALHLVVAVKAGRRAVVGAVRIVACGDVEPTLAIALSAEADDQLRFEALEALVGSAFRFGGLSDLGANLAPGETATSAALHRVGFTIGGAEVRGDDDTSTMIDRLTLDRAAWHRALRSDGFDTAPLRSRFSGETVPCHP